MEDKNRKSIRLSGYDYSSAGLYFITVCTKNQKCLFGSIVNGKIHLSEMGKIAETEWQRTPDVRPNIQLDIHVVMPNHIHGIIHITHKINGRGVLQYAPTTNTNALQSPSQTIGAIIRGFKSSSTKQINKIRNMPGIPIWQRNYYEHIIHNEQELNRIREYIAINPTNWGTDRNNLKSVQPLLSGKHCAILGTG